VHRKRVGEPQSQPELTLILKGTSTGVRKSSWGRDIDLPIMIHTPYRDKRDG